MVKLQSTNGKSKSNGRFKKRTLRPARNPDWRSIEVAPSLSGVRINATTCLSFPAVYRAVSIIGGAIASMPLRVYRETTDANGRRRCEIVPNHPVDILLHRRPNPEISPMRWKEYSVAGMAIRGNAFNEVVWEGNGKQLGGEGDKVVAIYPIDPARMTVDRDEENREVRYIYQSDSEGPQTGFTRNKILHFALYGDDIRGKSPAQLFRETLGIAVGRERFSGSMIGKGLAPSGVLSHPGVLGDEGFERLSRQLNKRNEGPDNAGRVLILEDGMSWTGVAFSPKDAQLIEQIGFSVEEVARIWGVPPHLLMRNTDLKYNNVEQLDLDFVKHTLLSYMLRIEEEINYKLLWNEPNHFVKFDASALLRGDIKTRYEAYRIGRQWGWLSANDVREKENEPPLPLEVGDIYLSPVNMIPAQNARMIGQQDKQTAEEPEAEDHGDDAQDAEASSGHLAELFRQSVERLFAYERSRMERVAKQQPRQGETDVVYQRRMLDSIGEQYRKIASESDRMIGLAWRALSGDDPKPVCAKYASGGLSVMNAAWRQGGANQVRKVLDGWKRSRVDGFLSECFALMKGV